MKTKLLILLLVMPFLAFSQLANDVKKESTATGNVAGATYGSDGSVSDAELLRVDATSSVQTQLDARCLESVFGTAIGTGIILDATTLKTSLTLQSLTGLTETNGGIPYGTSDNNYAWLGAGTAGYVLQGNGVGAPSWLDIASGYQVLDGTLTALAGLTIGTNELIYGTGADAFSMLAVNSTGTNKFLRQVSSGAPSWEEITASLWTDDATYTYLTQSAEPMEFRLSGLAHGMTGLANTDAYANFKIKDASDGGLRILGLVTAADEPGIHLAAVMTETTPTDYPMKFSVAKKSSTTWSPFSANRLGFAWYNDTQLVMTLNTSGDLATHGDLEVGDGITNEERPTFSILADADSDAGDDVSETFAITLPPNADPTLVLWTATLTQGAGFDFDMPLIASTLTSDGILKAGTSLYLTEQSSALADISNNGQFWVKDDNPNIPMYTDEDGTDFEVSLTGTGHASMFWDANATVIIPSTAAFPMACVNLTTGSLLTGFTFVDGSSGAITSVVDGSGSGDLICNDAAHGLIDGDVIVVHGMADNGHNGVTVITYITDNQFSCDDITHVSGTGSGIWNEPDYLQVSASGAGEYHLSYNCAVTKGAGTSSTVTFKPYKDATLLSEGIMERTIPSTDQGDIMGQTFLTVVEGDRLFLVVINQTNTNTLLFKYGNYILERL